jgi:hypothetical protein
MREDRPFLDAEFAAARTINLRTDDVGGQQVGGELDAAKAQAQASRQRAVGLRLGQAGLTFEEEMAAGEETDQPAVNEDALADDDFADLGVERVEAGAQFGGLAVDLLNVRGHVASSGIGAAPSFIPGAVRN